MISLASIRQQMSRAAQMARLPLRAGLWSGLNGQIHGHGTGNSLDFQDQRPYVPGDDPRHINWQAYARNGSYTMKLYRQEVSPRVDLIIDSSPSMFADEAKERRVWELAWFSIESSLRLGASLKVHWAGSRCQEVPADHLMADRWPEPDKDSAGKGPHLEQAPLRPGALRVLISDLLFPAAPEHSLTPLTARGGRAILLVPYSQAEATPAWNGNIEFEDSETGRRDKRRVPPATLERYLEAYRRHFELWREPCQRRGIAFARVPGDIEFLAALRAEAVKAGAVELI